MHVFSILPNLATTGCHEQVAKGRLWQLLEIGWIYRLVSNPLVKICSHFCFYPTIMSTTIS